MAKTAKDLRIVLIDQSKNRADALEDLLRESGYTYVFRIVASHDLVDQVADVRPDIVLVEIDSPQRDILEQLATLRDKRPTPVAVFCQDAQAQSIRAAVESGVCAYVVEGIQPEQVQPAISLAMATFSAFSRLRQEAAAAREELDERKKIDRAKRLLMSSQGLTEEQAFQAIKKLAMDRHRKIADAAEDLTAALRILGNQSG